MNFKVGDIVQFNQNRTGVIIRISHNLLGKDKPNFYVVKFFDGSVIHALPNYIKVLS